MARHRHRKHDLESSGRRERELIRNHLTAQILNITADWNCAAAAVAFAAAFGACAVPLDSQLVRPILF